MFETDTAAPRPRASCLDTVKAYAGEHRTDTGPVPASLVLPLRVDGGQSNEP